MKPESKSVAIEGAPVHYVDYGGTGDVLVLVHGLGGSHVNWCGVGPKLAANHRVLAVDLVGFGRTRLHGRAADIASNAKMLVRFVEDVAGGRQAPVTLVGNSMGGAISMMAAARAPSLVRSLVLVDAAFPRARGAKLDRQVALMFATYMVPWLGERALAKYSSRLTAKEFVHQMMRLCAANARGLDPAYLAEHVALAEERRAGEWGDEGHAAFLAAARSLVKALLAKGVMKAASAVRVPTLVVHGDRDRLVPVESARAMAEARGWDLHVWEGVGHVPQLEVPDAFTQVVEDWLARTHAAAAA